MLGKLIKLDLRFAYKKFLIMAGLLLIFGLARPYFGNSLQGSSVLVFAVVMTAVPIMSIWLVVQHFYRNLFGAEGYLMFSLPARASELLLSKLITTAIWFNLMLGSGFALVILLLRAQIPVDRIQAIALNWDLPMVLQMIGRGLNFAAGVNIIIIPMILAIFMGISLSTVAVRNKKLGMIWGIAAALTGIGSYGWALVKLPAWDFLNLTVNGSRVIGGGSSIVPSELINLAVSLAFSALFFWVTTYIMKHKLNLE